MLSYPGCSFYSLQNQRGLNILTDVKNVGSNLQSTTFSVICGHTPLQFPVRFNLKCDIFLFDYIFYTRIVLLSRYSLVELIRKLNSGNSSLVTWPLVVQPEPRPCVSSTPWISPVPGEERLGRSQCPAKY